MCSRNHLSLGSASLLPPHFPCCLDSFHHVLYVSVNIFIYLGSVLLSAFPSLCFFLELSCHVVVS